MTRPSHRISDPAPRSDSAAIAARIDRVPTNRFHYRLASILGGGTFFDGFDAISLAVVLPLVIATFDLSFSEAGLIISTGYVGQWLGALIVGALADRIGRKPAFILSLTIFGALSIACAFAWHETSLLLFRALQGFGLGAEVPVAGTLINEYLSKHNRGRISVVYQSMFSWGLFFAPLVALAATSALGPELGWRVLLGIGALPLLIAVWAYFALPESARWLADRGRKAEADALVRRMEDDARAAGKTLPEPDVLPSAGTSTGKLRLGELFAPTYRQRTFGLVVIWFTTFFVTYGYVTWLPTMYVSVGDLPASRSLLLTIVLGAIQLVVVYVSAWLVDRVGRRPLLMAAFGLGMTGGLFGAVAIGLFGLRGWPVLFGAGVILALGMTVNAGILYLYTSELYPTRMRGWATSACSSLNRAASIVSPFIFGFMLSGHGGPAAVFTALAVAAAIGLVATAIGGLETRNQSLEELS